ncbi:tRNA pseudouridine(38-40) synthase TruA [Candidatus Pantoea edessiphila]|uniref:tRNA pseudouridine synthase A n=1 Tax=Candidatus Pantoea edessiphila TaxID=2044610 RepID=A0A2P5T2V4_9GAMM|nr:tRNA pseudouridine(38-40) synthase TruA [Candidatus Pantoea edessiphila]PPI88896.1 tRNA pseudouridine(38-40) synthase TruA [Candidatus Pantoea edessiphila]
MFIKISKKIALCVEYDGTKYHGWQRQADALSIQEELEHALSQIANHSINVFCAGRTDAGVHSTGQIVHFKTNTQRSIEAWTSGVNTNLPDSISIIWAKVVSDKFHARFSATARRYRYIIYNNHLRPSIFINGLAHIHYPLDEKKMEHAGSFLIGEHDFTSFCDSSSQLSNHRRNLIHLNVIRQGKYVVIDVKANAFLYHMVRNIVGNLIDIGCGKKSSSWMKTLLLAKNRILGLATAKAKGLYLVEVDYPLCFCLPKSPIGPLFF